MLTKRARERQAWWLGRPRRALWVSGGSGNQPPPAGGSSGPADFSELLVMPVSELA
jgi:hypothetical protein